MNRYSLTHFAAARLDFEFIHKRAPMDPNGKLAKAMAASFTSVEAWMADFRAIGFGWLYSL